MSLWGLAAPACVLGGYTLGSVPFGLLLTRAAGTADIRTIGSGNIGATNVLRSGRRDLAAATLLLDAAKGALAVIVAGAAFGATWMPVAAVAAVIGHCFPVWLRFAGGKGVATGLGVFLALDWRVGAGACATWLALAGVTRLSSMAALGAFVTAPLLTAVLCPPWWWLAGIAMSAIVWWRHAANLRRLVAGTEPHIGARR